MANKISIHLDPIGNTLNIWWGKPDNQSISEESRYGDDVIIVNKDKQAIGLEKINFFPEEINPLKYLMGKIDQPKLNIFLPQLTPLN